MTLLPGWPRAAVRQLRVPADAGVVMDWLTDSDRRERELRRQFEGLEDIEELSIVRLPCGGLRYESAQVLSDLVVRHIVEDAATSTGSTGSFAGRRHEGVGALGGW